MAFRNQVDDNGNIKVLCKLGLVVSWVIGMVAIISGVVVVYLTPNESQTPLFVLPATLKEVFPLLVNVFVTLLNDSMGYIHTCSLRWSLQREGKLEFNSNLRLLTSARRSAANAWYANALYLTGVVLAYSSTSLIFLSLSPGLARMLGYPTVSSAGAASSAGRALGKNEIHVNPFAVITFGAGLVVQAVVATWALVSTDIPCWSSNPLEVVRECMNENEGHRVHHRVGRCMMGVHQAAEDRRNVHPRSRQRPMFTAHRSVRWVFYLLVVLPAVGAGWGGIVYYLIVRGDRHGILGESWSLLPDFDGAVTNSTTAAGGRRPCTASGCTGGTSVLNVGWSVHSGAAESVAAIFYIAAFQAVLTLSLHCAELLVNLSRDEAVYRKLTAPRGSNGHANSILAAATSWQALVLFFFKAAVHWMFGLAINVSYRVGINMYPPQILYFSALSLAVALFGAFLVFHCHRGYLPSTFGHIQTIADLVDEWADSGCMFWGHKADGETPDAPSYAGTSTTHSLRPPYPDRLYGGVPVLTRDELMYRLGYAQASSQLLQEAPGVRRQRCPEPVVSGGRFAGRASRDSFNSAYSLESVYSAASHQSSVPLMHIQR